MKTVRRAQDALGWLRRRAANTSASLTAVCLAISCGLSPVEDLPSAVDGLNVDSSSDGDGLDLAAGSGGSTASASGGAPGCDPIAPHTTCHGAELWLVGPAVPTCNLVVTAVEVCELTCSIQPDGVAACDPTDGGGVGGLGGSAGATGSADDGEP